MELNIPAVYGIGSSLLYFVDRYGQNSVYDWISNSTITGKLKWQKPGWIRSH